MGGVGRKRAVFDVAAANLSPQTDPYIILQADNAKPPETTTLYFSAGSRLGLFSVPLHELLDEFISTFFLFGVGVWISDCVRIRDKDRASFIAPGFGAGTPSLSKPQRSLVDPGPSNGTSCTYASPGNISEL